MADVKWVKITTDMFDNRKIKHIRKLPEGNNIILIWVMLLSLAGKCNASGMIFLTENIPYTEKMLADELGFEENVIRVALAALESFGMISRDDGQLLISNWEEYQNVDGMDRIREQTRKRVASYRSRKKQELLETSNADKGSYGNATVTYGNAIDIEEDIERDKENIYCAEKLHDEQSLDDFFESIWKLYPIKKGEGQVSKSRKKALQKIGYDQISRCVDRFLKDMSDSGRDRKYWMHGSTFFNSGYVDYLDKNWEQEAESVEEPRKPDDRFSCLESSFRKQLEDAGAIYDGQGLDYGILSEHPDWLKKIQESGV